MGNNAAFTAFERAVIGAYDQGTLTLAYLDSLAEPYRNTDIDMGGSEDRNTKDGKPITQVVVEMVEPEWKPTGEDEYFEYYLRYDEIRQTRWGWL